MSDENDDIENEDGAEGEEGKKKGLPKLVLFGGLGAVILILAGVAAFLLLSGGSDEEVVAEGEHGEYAEAHAEDEYHSDEVYYYDLREGDGSEETITTNIRSIDGRPVIVQLKLTFESSDPDLGPVLEEHVDPIMDQFIVFLRELREDDLYGSAGMHRVRLELLRRVNLAIEPSRVDAVWIQEFMIVD
ncbi:MAG: flagellar basal body-associated protein FliL [Alphaproteobacteria bacterium]|nr:flagellar basal body-associated protein FliL [Alphaproteobacteria bacterium]